MAGLGSLTGATGMAGLVTPTFNSGGPIGLGGPPTPGSPVSKTGLSVSATGLTGFSQMQHHVRHRIALVDSQLPIVKSSWRPMTRPS